MGGHAAGEVASQLVIAALAHLDDDEPGGDLLSQLNSAVHEGNTAIAAHVEADPELEKLLDEEEAIERSARQHHETAKFHGDSD